MIEEITQGMLVRLNKFIAHAGVCSRRKADELIRSGKVHVNGKSVSNLGMRIDPRKDVVFVNEKQVVMLDEPVYIVLNKPRDCITTASDERGRATVMDYVHVRERVFPVGRLDRHTTGVLLLTNDGEFANRLMHPKSEIKKTYKVTLDKSLNPGDAEKLAGGIRLSEATTAPAEIHILPGGKKKIVGIAIREGRNRQVHRMFEALGYEVEKLDRVSYAGISSEGLARGQSRYLTKRELRALKELAGME
jgi:23S rRNA pseudouridine2605 synthase